MSHLRSSLYFRFRQLIVSFRFRPPIVYFRFRSPNVYWNNFRLSYWNWKLHKWVLKFSFEVKSLYVGFFEFSELHKGPFKYYISKIVGGWGWPRIFSSAQLRKIQFELINNNACVLTRYLFKNNITFISEWFTNISWNHRRIKDIFWESLERILEIFRKRGSQHRGSWQRVYSGGPGSGYIAGVPVPGVLASVI